MDMFKSKCSQLLLNNLLSVWVIGLVSRHANSIESLQILMSDITLPNHVNAVTLYAIYPQQHTLTHDITTPLAAALCSHCGRWLARWGSDGLKYGLLSKQTYYTHNTDPHSSWKRTFAKIKVPQSLSRPHCPNFVFYLQWDNALLD